jgi:hypothetical protein
MRIDRALPLRWWPNANPLPLAEVAMVQQSLHNGRVSYGPQLGRQYDTILIYYESLVAVGSAYLR